MASPASPTRLIELKRVNSSPSNSTQFIAFNNTLSHEYFAHLIKVEQEFRSQSYTIETLDELVQLYARAVEYFDSIQEGISSYFTFKIHDTLATKRSLELLYIESQKETTALKPIPLQDRSPCFRGPKKSKSLTMQQVQDMRGFLDESSDEEDSTTRRISLVKNKKFKRQETLDSMKFQRQRYVQFFHKVEGEKASYERNLHTVMDEHKNSAQENDEVIQRGLDNQRQRIQQRLNKRKQETFISYTMNNSGYSLVSPRGFFSEPDEITDSDTRKESSGCSSDLITPSIFPRPLFAKSQFSKREVGSASKTDTKATQKRREEGIRTEAGMKYNMYTTPIEKLSTEDSFSEMSSPELIKLI